MTTRFWLSSSDFDESEKQEFDYLALHSVTSNQWPKAPEVTADEFRRFISAWADNDHNGTFNPDGIEEGDGALFYTDNEGTREMFKVCGMFEGKPVYAIWDWGMEL
ncbi:hypothetical protein ACRU44_20120 [Mycobacterium colombiense]